MYMLTETYHRLATPRGHNSVAFLLTPSNERFSIIYQMNGEIAAPITVAYPITTPH